MIAKFLSHRSDNERASETITTHENLSRLGHGFKTIPLALAAIALSGAATLLCAPKTARAAAANHYCKNYPIPWTNEICSKSGAGVELICPTDPYTKVYLCKPCPGHYCETERKAVGTITYYGVYYGAYGRPYYPTCNDVGCGASPTLNYPTTFLGLAYDSSCIGAMAPPDGCD